MSGFTVVISLGIILIFDSEEYLAKSFSISINFPTFLKRKIKGMENVNHSIKRKSMTLEEWMDN